MTKLLAVFAIVSLAACTDSNTISGSWEMSERGDEGGACLASLTQLDNHYSDVIRVGVVDDTGTVVASDHYNCEERGFSVEVPPNLTEVTVDIYRFSGNALEYDPKSAPLYARSFRVAVGADGADLGLIGF